MIKWLISLMMACSQTLTLSACNPDDSPKKTENIVPELKPESNPVPSPEPTSDNGMFDLSEGENGNPPTLLLSSGYEMPIIGLGTYSLHDDVCMNAILAAVKLGYRKFDTASYYGNEEEVGKAIRTCGVLREELFVCTKLYPNQFADAEKAIEESLCKLNIGYVDLMLLHHPGAHDVEAYKAMERAVKNGKIRSIGVSNYYIKEMTDFLPKVNIKPTLVAIEGWYPLGGRGYTAAMLGNGTIGQIAKAHGKSPAQIILRWDLQNGIVIIPGSSNPDHQRENISLFDFELSSEEMAQIAALDRNEKHDWY